MIENHTQNPNYLSIRLFAEANPAFTQSSLRALIFRENENGLKESGSILRIGKKKVLINVDKFFNWIEQVGRC